MKVLKIFGVILGVLVLIITICYFMQRNEPIVMEHTFNAPVARVWPILTDAETMKKWWGPHGFTAPVIKQEVWAGGRFLYGMQDDKGKTYFNTGTFTEVVPEKRIASKMSFADETGKEVTAASLGMPGSWPEHVTVVIELFDEEGKTHIKVSETGIPFVMRLFGSMGWHQQFEKIDALLK